MLSVTETTAQLILEFFAAYGLTQPESFTTLVLPTGEVELRLNTGKVASAVEQMLDVVTTLRVHLALELHARTAAFAVNAFDDFPQTPLEAVLDLDAAPQLTAGQQEAVITEWISSVGSWDVAHTRWNIIVRSDLSENLRLEVPRAFVQLFLSTATENVLIADTDFRLTSERGSYYLTPFDVDLISLVFEKLTTKLEPVWGRLEHRAVQKTNAVSEANAVDFAQQVIAQAVEQSIEQYGVENNPLLEGIEAFTRGALNCDFESEQPIIPLTPECQFIVRTYLEASGLTANDFSFGQDITADVQVLILNRPSAVLPVLKEFFSDFAVIRRAKITVYTDTREALFEARLAAAIAEKPPSRIVTSVAPVQEVVVPHVQRVTETITPSEPPSDIEKTIRILVRGLTASQAPRNIALDKANKGAQWLLAQAGLAAEQRHPQASVVGMLNIRLQGPNRLDGILFSLQSGVTKEQLAATISLEPAPGTPSLRGGQRVQSETAVDANQLDIQRLRREHPHINQLMNELEAYQNAVYLTKFDPEVYSIAALCVKLASLLELGVIGLNTGLLQKYWKIEKIEGNTAVNIRIQVTDPAEISVARLLLCQAIEFVIVYSPPQVEAEDAYEERGITYW